MGYAAVIIGWTRVLQRVHRGVISIGPIVYGCDHLNLAYAKKLFWRHIVRGFRLFGLLKLLLVASGLHFCLLCL